MKLFLNRFRRQFLSRVSLVRLLLIFLVLVVAGAGAVIIYFFRRPASHLFTQVNPLTQTSLPELNNHVNFVVLGIGGEGHDAPRLTDTIIFVSVQVNTGKTLLLSIPRDIWVPSLRAKINTAYHYGFAKEGPKGGLLLAKSAVSEIINQPVHFAAVIDFSTFSRAIDLLGGIDVDVERAFDDPEYPLPGRENDLCGGDPKYACRYEQLHFAAGLQHMNGDTALKFVRSRHAEGQEGTDFARSRRQERVLRAVKARLVSPDTLKHPSVYRDLINLLSSSVISDLSTDYYYSLFDLGLKVRRQEFISQALSDPDQLYHPPVSAREDYQWVLLPRDNRPQNVFDFVSAQISLLDK